MSFFAKVKQFFGAGTVKIELSVPPSVPKAGLQVPGKITLNALSDQHIIDVTVRLEEEWDTGRGSEKETKSFELGKLTIAEAFDMKQGEKRVLDFVLPFELIKSNADELKEKGGALGMLGKAAAFANAEKSRYKVKAEADVKGAAFDPSDDKELTLTQ
jgi:hypothetical protein